MSLLLNRLPRDGFLEEALVRDRNGWVNKTYYLICIDEIEVKVASYLRSEVNRKTDTTNL